MSFEFPTSEIRLARVPFGIDGKNVFYFSSGTKSQLVEDFTNNYVFKAYSDLNIIKHTKEYIDIKGNFDLYDNFNYIIFKNPELDNKWYFAFVKDVEYKASLTTRIHIKIDAWHTFIYDTTFYDCIIERSHIRKSLDTIGYNTEPEPVSFKDVYESSLKTLDFGSWEPNWVLEATSIPLYGLDTSFAYGGFGTGYSRYGSYGIIIEKFESIFINDFSSLLKEYAEFDTQFDHRVDIIGLNARPKWLIDELSPSDYETGVSHPYGTLLNNDAVSKTLNIFNDFNFTQTASGYTPRNKKLLSSLYSNYKILNYKGFQLVLKPELIADRTSFTIQLTGRPISGNIAVDITYNNILVAHSVISYNYSEPIVYNNNDSVAYKLKSLTSMIGSLGNAAYGVSAVAGGAMSGNPAAVVGGTLGSASSVMNFASTAMAMTESDIVRQGSFVGEFAQLDSYYSNLRLYHSSPIYNECVHIDKFFDVYGYAQNTIGNIRSNMITRSNWNYIKTQGANIKTNAPADYEEEIREMLNNGVTIWHTYSSYGDYDATNS